jgi:hypothetical protein
VRLDATGIDDQPAVECGAALSQELTNLRYLPSLALSIRAHLICSASRRSAANTTTALPPNAIGEHRWMRELFP